MDLRLDGTPKGPGFASATLPDGSVITEMSLGHPATGAFFPMVYEGITPWDMQTVQNMAQYGYDPLQYEVMDRAYTQYLVRAMMGLPAFWTPADGMSGLQYTPRNW